MALNNDNSISLTADQKIILQHYLEQDQKAGKNYANSYAYLYEISVSGHGALATSLWFHTAVETNSASGSLIDNSLRNLTDSLMQQYGSTKVFSAAEYQRASNLLAQNLISQILKKGEIPTTQNIVNMDSKNFSDQFGVPDGVWPGALIYPVDWNGDVGQLLSNGYYAGLGNPVRGYDGNHHTQGWDQWIIKSGANLGDAINDLLAWGKLDFNSQYQIKVYDPLVLDLDGDGIETIATDGFNGALFDHDKDGIATGSGWVKSDDGFLVYDRNQDGLINDGSELFGDNTVLKNGELAANGFAALADLDSNNDGVIDANDEFFSSLKVWRDLNQDGRTDAGELFSLKDLGIRSLNLTHENTNQALNGNNILTQIGSYTKEDGSIHQMGDLNLAADHLHTDYTTHLELTEEQAKLANIKGQGRIRDLREAAVLSEDLAVLLNSYSQAQTRESQLVILEQLLIAWAKTDPLYNEQSDAITLAVEDPESNNIIYVTPSELDYKSKDLVAASVELAKLTGVIQILDAFSGTKTNSINLLKDPNGVINTIKNAYQSLLDATYNALLLQTRLKPYLDKIKLNISDEHLTIDYSGVNQAFQNAYQQDPKNAFIDLAELIVNGNLVDWNGRSVLNQWYMDAANNGVLESLLGALSAHTLSSLSLLNPVIGTAENDVITSTLRNSNLFGGAGDDILDGSGSFYGGIGNDHLYAIKNSSSDTFFFNLGDGQDVIFSHDINGFADKIVFGDLITADMISYQREGDDFIIVVGTGGDTITIKDYFASHAAQTINRFEFVDGSVLENFLPNTTITQHGSGEADEIVGTMGNDVIYGDGGDDVIYDYEGNNYIDGGDGDDQISGRGTLIGGSGNDSLAGTGTLIGGTGDDMIHGYNHDGAVTVVFNLGDGQDTIYCVNSHSEYVSESTILFGKGITPDMLSFSLNDNDLIISIGQLGDQITLQSYNDEAGRGINRFEFSDGTVWNNVLDKIMLTQNGTFEDDYLYGSGMNDSIFGGDGNDVIVDIYGNNYIDGGAGDDVLEGGYGTFKGGTGNDIIHLYGKEIKQDDGWNWTEHESTFIFNLGDGQDEVWAHNGTRGNNIIKFGVDVTPEMVSFVRSDEDGGEGDLIILIGNLGDKITLKNYLYGEGGLPYRLEFANGTVLKDISTLANIFLDGTDSDDHIMGTSINDIINSGDGDDVIIDYFGNNYIDGGAGNDIIEGGYGTFKGGTGNDQLYISGNVLDYEEFKESTILFNLGDGQDEVWDYSGRNPQVSETNTNTIRFGKDVTSNMVSFIKGMGNNSNDLIIIVGNQGDQITLKDYLLENYDRTFHRIEFEDGTIWQSNKLEGSDFSYLPVSPSSVINQVNNLISAMAAFAPESGSSSSLPTHTYDPNSVMLASSAA